MSIAITEDHLALGATVSDFLVKFQARTAARELLEAADEPNASFYGEAANLGWLGLHVPEELGGSGFGLEEVVVVVEELGRALTPGAFVPTLIASAVLVAAGTDDVQQRLLPGLADGSLCGAVALGGDVELRDGVLHGSTAAVLGAGLADVILVPVGDDVAVVDATASGVSIETPSALASRTTTSSPTGTRTTSARPAPSTAAVEPCSVPSRRSTSPPKATAPSLEPSARPGSSRAWTSSVPAETRTALAISVGTNAPGARARPSSSTTTTTSSRPKPEPPSDSGTCRPSQPRSAASA